MKDTNPCGMELPAASSSLESRLSELEETVARIEELLARIGGVDSSPNGSRRLGEGADLETLSPRETEILRVFLDGNGVGQIAGKCFISEHTVRNHLKSIYRKLGVRSQMELYRRFRARLHPES